MDGQALRKLAADLTRSAVTVEPLARMVVAKTARDIEADAKVFAPVDTGNLEASITSDVKGLSAEIGPTASYGIYQELGTSKMAPQPFMGPAAGRRVGPFEKAMAQLAEDGLRG